MALAGIVAMLFVTNATAVLTCVFVASLGISNIFGMIFGQAMNHLPQKANEIAGLMVMAIAGGAVIPPLMGAAKSAWGVDGIIYVLALCGLYLLGLSLFSLNQRDASKV